MNQMVSKTKKNNNSSNSLVFGRWLQTKMNCAKQVNKCPKVFSLNFNEGRQKSASFGSHNKFFN